MTEFDEIVKYSQSYPFEINTQPLLDEWRKAKKPFFRIFGGKRWRTKEKIKIEISPEERKSKFQEFVTAVSTTFPNPDFDAFLRSNEDSFFDNVVTVPCPSHNIPAGMKLLKSFRKFSFTEETVRAIQDTASTYIQSKKLEGYLYFSVDPLDFLTMSENAENWSSCQSLSGGFRAGILNYITDPATFIAFVANEEPKHLSCLPKGEKAFSKKWRMLVHTTMNDIVYYDCQYPFYSKELINIVHENFQYLSGMDLTMPKDIGFQMVETQFQTGFLNTNQLNAGGRTYDTRDIINTSDYLGYSDLIHSSRYAPVAAIDTEDDYVYKQIAYSFRTSKEEEDILFKGIFGIKIGAKAPCVKCGKNHISNPAKFICDECITALNHYEDYFTKCYDCGKILRDDDIKHYYGDFGPDLLNIHIRCEECEQAAMEEDRITLEAED